jgi:U4/U6.U5 tri-snRNP-associated protein 3
MDVPPPPPPPRGGGKRAEVPPPPPPPPGNGAPEENGEEDEEAMMMRMMGFSGFNTTQGQRVDDEFANASAVQKNTKRQARQYMNRKGGFNRPLPAEVTGQRQNRT